MTYQPTQREPSSAEVAIPSFRSSMLRGPSFGGLVGALVFFWFSLTPSLLPRWWVMQAVITGLTSAIGYLIGTTIGALGRAAVDRFNATAPAERTRRITWVVLLVVAALAIVIGLARWPSVQNASRDLVNLDRISWSLAMAVALAAAVVFVVACAVGRLLLYLVRRIEALAQRFMPQAVAWIITVALVAVIAYILSVDVVERELISFVDARFGAADTGTAAGVVAPSEAEYSGSPNSLVPWETLGLEGRNFVAGAPSAGEIDSFSGSGTAQTPIRVYAGLDSAATLEQRAALVVLELDRANAAERAAVVVVTTTGTGWVDPDAATAVEYMYDGDTAIAAIQYSFLPSWIQFLVGTELAGEAGAAINAAVYEWWTALDEPRPKLLLFGESLGSLGLETALSRDSVDESLESLTRSDGVLMTGPTASNPV